MQLHLIFLASLRDQLHCSDETVYTPDHIHTVADLITWLRGRGGDWHTYLQPPTLWRIAQNQVLVSLNTRLETEAEIAFLPPVTGG